MSRIHVNWGAENYEWAMRLRGTMSSRQAERETGLPAATIRRWWQGQRPQHLRDATSRSNEMTRSHCRRGHPLTQGNTAPNGRGGRQCRQCKAAAKRRWAYRTRREFHSEWNPDPLLAPLEKLWLPGPAVLDFVRSRFSDEEVSVQFPHRNDVNAKRWYELRNGREWIRFDTAEKFLGVLGIVSSELGVDAVYSTVMPTRRAGGQQAAA